VVDTPVHDVPFAEYAIEFVPEPTAIHNDPFQYNLLHCVENTLVPSPVQVIPFVLVANVLPPAPAATQSDPLFTMS
jgi:hypothetical protein